MTLPSGGRPLSTSKSHSMSGPEHIDVDASVVPANKFLWVHDGDKWVPRVINAADLGDFTALGTYTVTWTATSANPALGNGTLDGYYRRIGKGVDFWVRLLWGSTTTPGTGGWRFSLPVTMANNNQGLFHGRYVDSSPVAHAVLLVRAANTTEIQARAQGGSTTISAGVPITWASGDSVWLGGFYLAA